MNDQVTQHSYRKKPVVIQAHRWDGTESGIQRIKAAFPELDTLGKTGRLKHDTVSHWRIGTLEGGHNVSAGDWIIRGIKGEFYPCKPDIFAATYEPAPEAPAPQRVPAEPVEYQILISGQRWTHCAKHIYDAAEDRSTVRALYTAPEAPSDDALLRQALEALKFGLHVGFDESSESQMKKGMKAFQQHTAAIAALKARLGVKA